MAEDELEEKNAVLEESKQKLERQKQLYELVMENSANGVMLIDAQTNRFLDANRAVMKVLKYDSKEEILQKSPSDLSPELQVDGESSFDKSMRMNQIAMEKGSHSFEWINLAKDGSEVYVYVTLTPIMLEGKLILHVVSQDISQRKAHEKEMLEQKERLDYQAHHDVLTKLPNRLLFSDRLHKAIQKATRDKTELALFFIDLDRFKQINDSLGHQMGDKVLIEVSNRLKNSMREGDSLARLGGDEFTVLMEGLRRSEDASTLAKKIIDTIIEPMEFDGHKLYLSASIGISLFPNDDRDLDKLLMYADSAMYKAKDEGRNNFQFYSSQMTALATQRMEIESKLYKAIDNEEFLVYYQPQIDAREKKIIGMEALVRWNHPTDGIIPPFEFIGIAEDNGLIVPIDLWVMDTAMRQVVEWYKEGLNPGVLALNLSLKQLHQENFIETFAKILKRTGCKAEWVELEVTESSIMQHPEDSIVLLNKLSAMGIELAIDDFGTGYSSLSYLKRLPLDKLKIDKSFIDDIPHKEEDIGISKAIIALAKSLNLRVIAEGVETQEQLDFLLANDCDNIQGYFFSKPLPFDAMQEYLQNPKLNG